MSESKRMLFGQDNADRVEHDYYATDPKAAYLFLNSFLEKNDPSPFWEPACGEGHLAEVLEDYVLLDRSSDLIDRGYGEVLDFLKEGGKYGGSIITNPPFLLFEPFIEKALSLVSAGNFVIFFGRIQIAESKKRAPYFKKDIHSIYLHTKRVGCAPNGDFTKVVYGMTYAWFVWQKGFKGAPKFYWI